MNSVSLCFCVLHWQSHKINRAFFVYFCKAIFEKNAMQIYETFQPIVY